MQGFMNVAWLVRRTSPAKHMQCLHVHTCNIALNACPHAILHIHKACHPQIHQMPHRCHIIHMLVDSDRLDMTSCFVTVWIYCTLIHPWVTHSVIFKTTSDATSSSLRRLREQIVATVTNNIDWRTSVRPCVRDVCIAEEAVMLPRLTILTHEPIVRPCVRDCCIAKEASIQWQH